MNRYRYSPFILGFILIFVFGMSLVGCASTRQQVIDTTTLPAAVLAWGNEEFGVQSDTLRGIQDAIEDEDVIDAVALLALVENLTIRLETGDMLGNPWPGLEPFAERGIRDRIDDGELTEELAEFLRGRAVRFTEALEQMVSLPTSSRAPAPQLVRQDPRF